MLIQQTSRFNSGQRRRRAARPIRCPYCDTRQHLVGIGLIRHMIDVHQSYSVSFDARDNTQAWPSPRDLKLAGVRAPDGARNPPPPAVREKPAGELLGSREQHKRVREDERLKRNVKDPKLLIFTVKSGVSHKNAHRRKHA